MDQRAVEIWTRCFEAKTVEAAEFAVFILEDHVAAHPSVANKALLRAALAHVKCMLLVRDRAEWREREWERD